MQVVHASTPGFPVVPEAALTVDAGDVRVSVAALVQQPDPRVPLHLLPSPAVAARLAVGQSDGCLAAVQTALMIYLHQRACCEPLAVRLHFTHAELQVSLTSELLKQAHHVSTCHARHGAIRPPGMG